MKVYVINLAKNVERMEHMSRQLKRLGIDFERVPAVYGASLTKEERKGCFAPFRSFCAMGYKLRSGEIGCALSHCNIYKKMIDAMIDMALVLEDDVVINDGVRTVVTNIERSMDAAKAQVFLLSSFGVKDKKPSGIEKIKGGMCTDGYVITRPAAQRIYRANYPVVTVADKWMRWEKRFGVEMYRAWPTTVCQDNESFGTDIALMKSDVPEGIRKLILKACRAFEVFIDWVWYKASGR